MLLLHGNPGFNFTCTCCIICYWAIHVVEIFHILKFVLSFICIVNLDSYLVILSTLVLSYTHFYSIALYNFSYRFFLSQ